MIRSRRNLANRSRNERGVGWYSGQPAGRLLIRSVKEVVCRPRHEDPKDLTLPEEALRRDVAELVARAGAPSATGVWW